VDVREALPMPVYPSYDFIDVLSLEAEPAPSMAAEGPRMSLPVVALVGRPNVGQVGPVQPPRRPALAIVSDEAGTTRDRHFGRVEWDRRAFWLVDTGGLADDQNVR
jgi:tRNA U34 5-carboxymethylaminomethyl modifying GTPase MnmE/TrmE